MTLNANSLRVVSISKVFGTHQKYLLIFFFVGINIFSVDNFRPLYLIDALNTNVEKQKQENQIKMKNKTTNSLHKKNNKNKNFSTIENSNFEICFPDSLKMFFVCIQPAH